jgi:hypothetical protein
MREAIDPNQLLLWGATNAGLKSDTHGLSQPVEEPGAESLM